MARKPQGQVTLVDLAGEDGWDKLSPEIRSMFAPLVEEIRKVAARYEEMTRQLELLVAKSEGVVR